MKKRTWIIAALFAVEAVAIALFFWTQRDVVHTVKNTPKSYTAETADGSYQPPKKVHDIVRDLTEEEKEALRTGQMTQEALIAALTGTATGAGNAAQGEDSQGLTEEELEYQHSLEDCIARSYLLREEFTMKLEAMMERAKQEYRDKTESEKTQEALREWAKGYMNQADLLEQECDGRMDEIVDTMRTVLKQNGGSMDLLDQVIYTYANEKEAKKEWYLNEMTKRGLQI